MADQDNILAFLENLDAYAEKNCQIIDRQEGTKKKSHFRQLLLFTFNRGQKASEVTKDICAIYGAHAIAERTVRDWFTRFKHGVSGDFT